MSKIYCDIPQISIEDDASSSPDNKNGSRTDQSRESLPSGAENPNEKDGLDPDKEEPRLRRASSLKIEKSSSDCHSRKIVRFADALGLDLEDVRVFSKEDISKVPSSAFADLNLSPREENQRFPSSSDLNRPDLTRGVPQFQQPGADAFFLERVKTQKVCLENVIDQGLKVTGLLRVMNLGFEKVVSVRYTTDEWSSHADLAADYIMGSSDGLTEKFSFSICTDGMEPNSKLSFVLKYEVNNQEFWDNNNGQNYTILYEDKSRQQNFVD